MDRTVTKEEDTSGAKFVTHGSKLAGWEKGMVLNMRKLMCVLPVMILMSVLCTGCSGSIEETMAESVSGNVRSEETSAEGISQNIMADDSAGQSADDSDNDKGKSAETDTAQESAALRSENDSESNAGHISTGQDTETVEEKDGADEQPDARREPVKVKGIYVSGPTAGIAKMDELIDLVDRTELNAMVIDIKNDEGRVTYKMESEQVLEIEAGIRYIPDIKELVTKCKEKDIYLIARLVAFRDPYLADKKPEWAVHTKSGGIFRDKNGMAWVNPYRREVWDYLVEIASQAAEEGFDEVQFDYIRFSTDINEEQVDYGPESEDIDKIQIITEFTEYMYEKLAPLGVYVAADVFGTVIDNEIDQKIVGQDYVQMAEHLDYICPMVYPSHYRNGAYGISVPDAEPYKTIYAAASSSVDELEVLPEESRAHVRMWLQSFTASWVSGHISYGPQQIREQIKGAYDAGYDEWILWNAAVNYQPASLLTDEEAEAERQQWDAEAELQKPEEAETELRKPDGAETELRKPEEAETELRKPEEAEAETQKPDGAEAEL